MMELFELSRANSSAIENSFQTVLAGLPAQDAQVVQEFSSWVASDSLISINVKLFVLVELLEGRGYKNIYEWAEEQSTLCGRSVDVILRERLQKFYDKRITFDQAFENGTKFRYGALNSGGYGLLSYDPYCVVLNESFQDSLGDNIAYLPGDSLKLCFAPDGTFNANVVCTCATPHSHRHFLVTRDCAASASTIDKRKWPNLVYSQTHYFEAIFLGDITLPSVYCIRIPKAEHDRMWDMAFSSYAKKFSDAERALVNDFVRIYKAERDGKIKMEVL